MNRILPFEYRRVAERVTVRLSRHFHYSDFGVRDTGDMRHYGRRYICCGTPGTGFVEHESESHTYHDYVRRLLADQQPDYWRYLWDREPSYERELKQANALLRTLESGRKRELVECYTNALTVGRLEEELQRLIKGVKRKMGRHHNKYYVSIISHYKRKAEQLARDMASVEFHVEDHYPPEVLAAYREMVDAFSKMVLRCRRIWHHNSTKRDNFVQVFFDLGIFDFIRYDGFLPVMRDSYGVDYYLLPDAVIVARGSLDFDLVPIRTMTMVCQETAIAEPTDLLSSRVGDAACMALIPELNLTFYFNHAHVVVDFVHKFNMLKALLPNTEND